MNRYRLKNVMIKLAKDAIESFLAKVTSPMTTTIRIPPCSNCGTILLTFFSDKTSGLEKNGGGIIIFGQSMN
jgi:hypothetical protein